MPGLALRPDTGHGGVYSSCESAVPGPLGRFRTIRSTASTEEGRSMAITTPRKLLVAVLSTVGQSLEGAIGSLQGSGRFAQDPETFEGLLHLDTACGFR